MSNSMHVSHERSWSREKNGRKAKKNKRGEQYFIISDLENKQQCARAINPVLKNIMQE